MELKLELAGGDTTTIVTDGSWDVFDADTYMRPSPGKNWYKHVLENTDARHEPVGWRSELAFKATGPGWAKATPVLAAGGGAVLGLHPKMSRPMQSFAVPAPVATPLEGEEGWFLVDFGREFQGGLILNVEGGEAGTTVSIMSGESRFRLHNKSYTGPVTSKVGDDWGYNFTWTLRDGDQTIEQHEYMEFRYVNLWFKNGTAPKSFNLSAWAVQYEWIAEDSHFSSEGEAGSNVSDTLNKVWELNRYTMQAGILDTYTDSQVHKQSFLDQSSAGMSF